VDLDPYVDASDRARLPGLVGVVGAGTMGSGIAALAALAGHPVRLVDTAAQQVDDGIRRAREHVARAQRHGQVEASAATGAAERIRPGGSLAALADAALVVEAISEDLTAKQELLAHLDVLVRRDALIATNTSSLPVGEVTARMDGAERGLGLHFFNPAPTMPLVEVVAGARTDDHTLTRAAELMRAWGKTPVLCADSPGFIVNRVSRPLYGEAHRLLEERAVDPATLDALIRAGAGLPMGPVALGDLVGQDVNFAVTRSIWEQTFHDARYTPSPLQQDWVRRGLVGRKAGRSVLGGRAAPCTARVRPAPMVVDEDGGLGLLQGLVERARRAGVAVRAEPRAAGEPGAPGGDDYPERGLLLPSGGRLMVTDGETATAHALDEPVVVLDWAVEPDTVEHVALAASAGCPDAVLDEALGFVQAAGVAASVVDDLPGLVVARTVSMIINEAYDVAARGVANEEDIDRAMRLGTGYPWGPFSLTGRIGAHRVVGVLDALHAWYPTGRYRVTPHLRRAALHEESALLSAWPG
jgi:3-hydroxybutyryl-CoA dehydrogenase